MTGVSGTVFVVHGRVEDLTWQGAVIVTDDRGLVGETWRWLGLRQDGALDMSAGWSLVPADATMTDAIMIMVRFWLGVNVPWAAGIVFERFADGSSTSSSGARRFFVDEGAAGVGQAKGARVHELQRYFDGDALVLCHKVPVLADGLQDLFDGLIAWAVVCVARPAAVLALAAAALCWGALNTAWACYRAGAALTGREATIATRPAVAVAASWSVTEGNARHGGGVQIDANGERTPVFQMVWNLS